jgi:hypothetical protein
MRTVPAGWLAFASLTVAMVLGCGKSPPPPSDASPVDATPSDVPPSDAPRSKVSKPAGAGATIDVASLPEVDGALPPLDDGRLTLSLPGDWFRLPRSKQYLVAAQLSRQAKYPAITIYVEAAGNADDMPENWDEDDLKDRAAELQADFDEQEVKLAEPVKPVRIGPYIGVQYARGAKVEKLPLERLFLVTVAGGRRYTVELRAVHGELHRYRSLALAVAASMRFGPSL